MKVSVMISQKRDSVIFKMLQKALKVKNELQFL